MNVAWPVLGVALLVLFFPSRFFVPEKSVWRQVDQVPDEGGSKAWWWSTASFWLDLIGGFAGALLLRDQVFSTEHDPHGLSPIAALLVVHGILLAAVLVRMPVPRRTSVCMAPVSLLAGMVWALLPPMVAAVATVLAICSGAAFRSFSAAFFGAAVSVAAAGFLLNAPRLDVVLLALIAAAPVLISLVSYRALALPSRR